MTYKDWRYPPPAVGAILLVIAQYGIGLLVAENVDDWLLGGMTSVLLAYLWFMNVSRHRRRK